MPELADISEVAGLGSFDGQASPWARSDRRDGCPALASMSSTMHDGVWDLTLTDRLLIEAKRLANRINSLA